MPKQLAAFKNLASDYGIKTDFASSKSATQMVATTKFSQAQLVLLRVNTKLHAEVGEILTFFFKFVDFYLQTLVSNKTKNIVTSLLLRLYERKTKIACVTTESYLINLVKNTLIRIKTYIFYTTSGSETVRKTVHIPSWSRS